MKNIFIKSTFILLIGGFITKFLGMFIRIVMSRLLPTNAMGSYMMIMPTFSLLIAISQFGFPTSISKLVSEDKHNSKDIVSSIIPYSILINIILILFCLCFSNYISINLLHDKNTYLGLKVLGFVLPFISISSIIRGYFFGKQKMFPHILSNIIEDIVRLVLYIIGIPFTIKYGYSICIMFLILTNIVSELISICVLLFFLPEKFKYKYNCCYVKDIMGISIPLTTSRIIGNIGYFFEPILFTKVLLSNGINSSIITSEYGIINGYVMPLLLLPSFFSNAISQSIIPVVSNFHSNKKYKPLKKAIRQGIFFSFIIGLIMTLFYLFFGNYLLQFIYNTNKGYKYLRVLIIPFLLFYIESPIISCMQAMNLSKETLRTTFFGVIIKLLSILIFCKLFNFWGYIISIIINIFFVTIFNYYILKKKTNRLL